MVLTFPVFPRRALDQIQNAIVRCLVVWTAKMEIQMAWYRPMSSPNHIALSPTFACAYQVVIEALAMLAFSSLTLFPKVVAYFFRVRKTYLTRLLAVFVWPVDTLGIRD